MVFTGVCPTEGELFAYYGHYPVHDHVSPVTLKRYNEILDHLEAYRRTGRLIDVGCGAGIFLVEAARRGWEVHGTEYGDRALAACRSRGIQIIEGALDPTNYGPGSFDVVCSFEVIEHVPDPKDELQKLVAILRPGGALYMTTPNYRSLGRLLSGKGWSVVNYPEHLNYFSPRTLRKLGRGEGLRTRKLRTTGISLVRLRAKRDDARAKKDAVLASQEQLRERLENAPLPRLAKQCANWVLDLLGIGDSMKATFIKPSGGPRRL